MAPKKDTPTTTRRNASCLCVATLMETLLYGAKSHMTASGLVMSACAEVHGQFV